jgi:hypothetical protein
VKRTVPASCQLSKRTGGGNEGRSAIGRPAVRQVRRRGGVPFCPLVDCTGRRAWYRFARWSAVRAAAGSGTRHRASPPGRRRMRVRSIRSRIRSMCSISPGRRGGVSRVPLPEHPCRVCSGCGLQRKPIRRTSRALETYYAFNSQTGIGVGPYKHEK